MFKMNLDTIFKTRAQELRDDLVKSVDNSDELLMQTHGSLCCKLETYDLNRRLSLRVCGKIIEDACEEVRRKLRYTEGLLEKKRKSHIPKPRLSRVAGTL